MSIEKAKAYLRQFGAEDRVIEFPVSSATVELAAEAATANRHASQKRCRSARMMA